MRNTQFGIVSASEQWLICMSFARHLPNGPRCVMATRVTGAASTDDDASDSHDHLSSEFSFVAARISSVDRERAVPSGRCLDGIRANGNCHRGRDLSHWGGGGGGGAALRNPQGKDKKEVREKYNAKVTQDEVIEVVPLTHLHSTGGGFTETKVEEKKPISRYGGQCCCVHFFVWRHCQRWLAFCIWLCGFVDTALVEQISSNGSFS